jgi:hypothetical protein
MMTSVYGELGIGKTYHLAKEVYEHYRQGCLTITNFKHVYSRIPVRNDPEILIEMIRQIGEFKRQGYELCDLLPTFRHGGIFMAIDEAHLTFGTELRDDPKMKFTLQFLSLARKQDVDIWYVVQDPAKIHKNFRRYTNDWIRYRAIIPIFRNKLVPHPTRPIERREKRLIIPWVWEERHRLDYENPVFNYARRYVDGIGEWAPASTIQSRRIRRTNDPFIHRLYDSHEMVGMKLDPENYGKESFNLLKQVAYIPYTMFPERFPTIKTVFGLRRTDMQPPTRVQVRNIDLPDVQHDVSDQSVKQPVEFVDDISFFLKHGGKRKVFSIPKPFSSPSSHGSVRTRKPRAGGKKLHVHPLRKPRVKAKNDPSGQVEKKRLRHAVPAMG